MTVLNSTSNQSLLIASAPSFNNIGINTALVVTAAGTTTLTAASAGNQIFTGATTQTCVMPVVSTLPQLGWSYDLINRSSGNVTVNSSGGNLIQTMATNTRLLIRASLLTGTTAASWDIFYIPELPASFPLSAALGGTGTANSFNLTVGAASSINQDVSTVGLPTFTNFVVASGSTTLAKSQNNTTSTITSNATNGTAALAEYKLTNNTANAYLQLTSTGYSGVSGWSNRCVLSTDTSISNGFLARIPAGGFQITTDGSLNVANFLMNSSGNAVLSGSLTTSQTLGIIGTTTNNNASAGSVGEFISSTIVSGSATSIPTSGVEANMTSISLTAGDWDLWGNVSFIPAGGVTTFETLAAWISSTSATLGSAQTYTMNVFPAGTIVTAKSPGVTPPPVRLSLSGTTTIYLSVYAVFGVSTLSCCGTLSARRRR